jgi:two-component system, NtrC family, sensor kinase
MSTAKEFKLLEYFFISSFITIASVTLLLTILFTHGIKKDFLKEGQDYATLIIKNLYNQIYYRFIQPTMQQKGYIDLSEEEQLEGLDQVVKLAISGLKIKSLYFFDLEGNIIYSTNRSHIGFKIKDNPNYLDAVKGNISSSFKNRGDPLDISKKPEEITLLETYVPIRSWNPPTGKESRPIVGVMETYQDATYLAKEIRAVRIRISSISMLGMSLLFLILFVIVKKADRVIQAKTQELTATNKELQNLTQELEDKVTRRTEQLIAQAKLASLGTLAAGIAHELNSPLGSIAICTEGLLNILAQDDQVGSESDREIQEYLNIINAESFRCKAIINSLLNFARQSPPMSQEEMEINELLRSTIRLFKYRATEEEKEIILEPIPHETYIKGDVHLIKQVIFNLTENALDAIGLQGRIKWSAIDLGQAISLICEDNGYGLNKEQLERVWDPFFTTKPVGQGTGLGLSLSYSAVKRHGGNIEIQSDGKNKGARAIITLPKKS